MRLFPSISVQDPGVMDRGQNIDLQPQAPLPKSFPRIPRAWHYACSLKDVLRKPVSCSIGGRELVLFASEQNQIVAMDRRCVHMGADLSIGCAANGRITCPFHAWEFDQTGRCVHIPASDQIPAFARQQTYPTAIIGSQVLVFNHSQALFEAPFYDGISPAQLIAAPPFQFEAELPWYMVAANGFDVQHFKTAHDRTLVDEPVISRPSPWAYRIRATFDVNGSSLQDRLIRRISGRRVTMTVTSWCGTVVLVTAEFARTTSYGMVLVQPIDEQRSYIRNIVWAARRQGIGKLLDPLDVAIRRWFIRSFVQSDRERSRGVRYNPGSLIDADSVLAGYFRWLGNTAQGESFNGNVIS